MPGHVSPRDSGIAARHRDAIEETMRARNCFLFVRPTEYDSTILIEEGFATKSMDIHDKSSNWGPMAGMVPCDPAFNKKATGNPNPNPAYHNHGEAVPVKLELPWSLYQRFRGEAARLDREMDRYLLRGDGTVVLRSSNPTLSPQDYALQMRRRFVTNRPVSTAGPKSTLFCLVGNTGAPQAVHWVHWTNAGKTEGRVIPLWVWAYSVGGQAKPVTGDYDLWMVAPHASAWQRHAEAKAIEDAHGRSTASPFTVALMDEMNVVCKSNAPSTNRVFNHGAESQNYGFTQALDPRLVMFTPVGESRMVEMSQIPAVLGDLAAMNYLVMHNKRYEELDPRIMNTSFIAAVAQFERNRDTRGVVGGIAWKAVTRTRFRKAMAQLEAAKLAKQGGRALAATRWDAVRAAVKHGYEASRMVLFYDELKEIFVMAGQPPTTLLATDFPAAQVRLSTKGQIVQHALQIAAVQGTVGSGETDPIAFENQVMSFAKKYATDLDEIYLGFEEIAGRPA